MGQRQRVGVSLLTKRTTFVSDLQTPPSLLRDDAKQRCGVMSRRRSQPKRNHETKTDWLVIYIHLFANATILMVKSRDRINISALESPVSEKAKESATLPSSAVRIDVEDNSRPHPQLLNKGLEIASPDEPNPPDFNKSVQNRQPMEPRDGLEVVSGDEPTPPPHSKVDEGRVKKEEDAQDETINDDARPEIPNMPSELPVAHVVNDNNIPQAFVLDDDAQNLNEKNESKDAHGRHCSRREQLIFFMFISSIILISIGLTSGFKPVPREEPTSTNATNGVEPPSTTKKSNDEPPPNAIEPPSCDLMAPHMIYEQDNDSSQESFCNEKYCWVRIGPIITAPEDTHFGDVIDVAMNGDSKLRFVVSARKESGCNGEETGIVRVYELTLEGGIQQVGQAIEGTMEEGDARGFISGDGQRVVVGLPTSNGPFDVNNVGGWLTFVYNSGTNRWVGVGEAFYGNLKKSRLGYTMALSHKGSIVAVGAPMAGDDKMGQVHVYRHDDSTGFLHWNQLGQTIVASNRNPDDFFGADLDLSEDGLVLAIGQQSQDKSKTFQERRGKVAIFRYSNQTWNAMGDEILGEQTGDAFGRSVGLSADGNVVVGGTNGGYVYDDNTRNRTAYPRAFIYNGTSGKWDQLGNDIVGNITLGGNVLNRVAMNADGTRVALTTQQIRGSGGGYSQAFEFDKDLGDWKPLGGIISLPWQTGGGSDISMSGTGNIIVLGAPDEVNSTVRLYKLLQRKD